MARDGIFKRLFGRARKWLASFRKPPAQPAPPVEAKMPEEPSPDSLPEMKLPDVPVLKAEQPDISTQQAGTPHLASRLEFPQSSQAPPPNDALPDDRSTQVRNESQAKAEARIAIRNAQKRGDADLADTLRERESQRRKGTKDEVLQNIADRAMAGGQTTVMPEEMRNDAPSPFNWTPPPNQTAPAEPAFPGAPRMGGGGLNIPPAEWQRIQQQAQQVMPPSRDNPNAMFPKQDNSQELLSVLKEMAESLKSIDGKLPQRATYSE